jgi:hypothetical protein
MYFFDPHVGRRRRALVRDRAEHLRRVVRDELATEVRDATNRLRGIVAASRRVVGGADGDVTDDAIAQDLRTRFARLERPDAIVVEVRDGCVHLRGPVLFRDAERARRMVRRARGARSFVDELEIHATPDVPALRSRARPQGFAQLDPAGRLAVGLVVAAAVLPLFRHVPIFRVARLLVLGALGSSVYSIEGARRRGIASGPRARAADGERPRVELAAARP